MVGGGGLCWKVGKMGDNRKKTFSHENIHCKDCSYTDHRNDGILKHRTCQVDRYLKCIIRNPGLRISHHELLICSFRLIPYPREKKLIWDNGCFENIIDPSGLLILWYRSDFDWKKSSIGKVLAHNMHEHYVYNFHKRMNI